jgi:hypothetical protein
MPGHSVAIIPDLSAVLSYRQASIMRHLWAHGSATVRELHTWLTRAEPLAYTSVLTTCVRLWEKGLLDRRHVLETDAPRPSGRAYVYTPRLSVVEFLRAATPPSSDLPYPQIVGIPHYPATGTDCRAIEMLLAYVGTLRDSTGQLINRQALDTIAALLERAESAERAVLIYQAEAIRAGQRATSAERRARAVEDGVSVIPPGAAPPRPTRATTVPSSAVYEFPGHEKVCRVCGRPAPPPSANRHDALRVCALPSCRHEARRRDTATKQRRYQQRQRAQRITASPAAEGDSV